MNRTIQQLGLAALALCCIPTGIIAGESAKYSFDGWTVTVTPRATATVPPQSAITFEDPVNNSGGHSRMTRPIDLGLLVRPVSMRQETPTPQPPPATAELAPPELSTTTPAAQKNNFRIRPMDLPLVMPRPRIEESVPPVLHPQVSLYREIYASLPFIRAEYNASPSYRHDATMEILFNQLRPTVIQRSTVNVNHYDSNPGYGFPYYSPYFPYRYGLRIHPN